MSQGVKFILQDRKTLLRKSGIFIGMILLVVGAILSMLKNNSIP